MSRERERHHDRNGSKSTRNHEYLVKLRGLPYTSSKDDIKKFLHPCRITTIHLFSNNGNSSGECLVDLESEIDVKDALKKTNQFIGSRYIEVFRANHYEYNFFNKHKGTISWREPVIRMNGLPYTCTMGEIQTFFRDIEIARNGIYISRDMMDSAVGVGYVALVNMENAYKAIDLYDKKNLQNRYVELTPSTYDEAKKTITNDAYLNGKRFADENVEEDDKKNNKNGRNKRSRSRSKRRSRSNSLDRRQQRPASSQRRRSRSRSRPQVRNTNQRPRNNNNRRRSRSRSPVRRSSPQNGELVIKMRGMPFNVVEEDIRKFFPSSCQPVRIEISQDRRTNRPNGDGYVYFSTKEEITEALKCDRKYMGSRYVELYYDSPRPATSNHRRSESKETPRPSTSNPRRSKSNETPHPSPSRSPSEPKDDDKSRSRSESPQ